jgi:hypothetical protein
MVYCEPQINVFMTEPEPTFKTHLMILYHKFPKFVLAEDLDQNVEGYVEFIKLKVGKQFSFIT